MQCCFMGCHQQQQQPQLLWLRHLNQLQHDHIFMLSYNGYFVPEYLKWPDHPSSAEELKFEDISDGLATFDKVLFIG